MSVKIKDFKMPETCEDCPFSMININDERLCLVTRDKDLIVTDLFLLRHDECPLEEVVD